MGGLGRAVASAALDVWLAATLSLRAVALVAVVMVGCATLVDGGILDVVVWRILALTMLGLFALGFVECFWLLKPRKTRGDDNLV